MQPVYLAAHDIWLLSGVLSDILYFAVIYFQLGDRYSFQGRNIPQFIIGERNIKTVVTSSSDGYVITRISCSSANENTSAALSAIRIRFFKGKPQLFRGNASHGILEIDLLLVFQLCLPQCIP